MMQMKRSLLLLALLIGALFVCLPAWAQTINPNFLPSATTSKKGAVIVGSGLSVSGSTLSEIQPITTIGSGLSLSGGTLSVTGGGGGGSLPTDYISGCQLIYDTTTAIQVSTGTAYNPIDSAADTIASTITYSPSLSASTLYYVYLASGGASVVVTTTAPATNYQGTAWKDSSGRRYLGCFRTDGSSHIIPFRRVGNRVYYKTNTTASPFVVLTNGTSTSSASVSCSSVVPATAFVVLAGYHASTGTGLIVSFSCSDGPSLTGSNTGIVNINNANTNQDGYVELNLNTSQAFTYINSGYTIYSTSITVDCVGYIEDR